MMRAVVLFVVLFGVVSSLRIHNETNLSVDVTASDLPRIVGYINQYGVVTSPATAYNVLILAFLYVDGDANIKMGGAIQGYQTPTTVSTIGLADYVASGKHVFLSLGGGDWTTENWQSILGKEATIAHNIRVLADALTSADTNGVLHKVKVAGVDIDYEDDNGIYPPNHVYNGVDLLITLSRELKKQGFVVSHAPQGPYLCTAAENSNPNFGECATGIAGYINVMAAGGHYIDFLNVQYYNNQNFDGISGLFDNYRGLVKGFTFNNAHFSIPANKLVVGKPNWPNDAGTGYIPVNQLISDVLCPLKREYADFGGAMTWEYHDDSWGKTVLAGYHACK